MGSGSSAFSNCLCGGSRSLCLSSLLLVSHECQSIPLRWRFWPEEANWVISRAAILGGGGGGEGNHYCNEVTTKIKIGIKWSMSESPASVLSDNRELGPYRVRVPVHFANKVLLSSGFLRLLLSDSCRNSPHSAVCPLFCSDGPRLPGRQWLPVNGRHPSAFKNHHLDFHILLWSRRLRYILPAWIY